MLRQILEDQGWPIAEIARRVGVAPPTIHRWLDNQSTPAYDNARKLATILATPELLEHWGYNGGATELRAETTHSPDVANGWRLDTLIAEQRKTNQYLARLVELSEPKYPIPRKEPDADIQ